MRLEITAAAERELDDALAISIANQFYWHGTPPD